MVPRPPPSGARRRASAAPSHGRPGVTAAVLLAVALLTGCTGSTSAAPGTDPDVPASPLVTAPAPTASSGPSPLTTPVPEPSPGSTGAADRHAEVGALVDDFPVDLLPVPQDAVLLVTSAVPVGDGDVQEVSLNLRTRSSVEDLVTLYRTTLSGAGFTEVTPDGATSSDLAAELTFTRSGGDELVSIGVLEVDGGRTVTIGGRVRDAA